MESNIFSLPVKPFQEKYQKEVIDRVNNEINSLNTQLERDTSQTSVNKRIDSISSKIFSEGEKKKIQKQLSEIRLNLSISNSKKYTYTDHDVNDSVQAVEVVQKALYKLKLKTLSIERELKNYIREISAKETFNTKEYTKKIDTIQYEYEKHLRYLSNLENEAEPFHNNEHKETIKSINDSNTSIGNQLDKLCDLNFENFLLPIDTNGENIDAVEVVLDRYTNEQSPKHIDSNKYTIWVQGGLKLDISAGIFITSLVDNEYYTEKDDNTPNLYSIYKKDKGNFDFGFGSMINLTYRSGNWANPTFGVGAIFTAQQKFQIISGLGLVMGRKERLILHGGISMGQVQGALGRFKDDGTEMYNLGDNPVVPMENKFRFGYFFGFTYNITGFKINSKP